MHNKASNLKELVCNVAIDDVSDVDDNDVIYHRIKPYNDCFTF